MTRTKRLAFESLERRQMLAGDLEIVSVDFTNAIGELTGTTPTVGEKIYARVHYRITDLTAADVYNISWELDEVTTKQFEFVGIPGTSVDQFWFHGGWIAEAGASHTLTVTVDSDDTVAEANEANNAVTLSPFTPTAPTSLPAKFTIPIAGTQNVDWVLGGYVDTNPKSFQDDFFQHFNDYQGNTTTTRDFHNGLDFSISNFAAQDAGVQVLAAAPGTIIEIRDGDFDRQTALFNGDVGNYVFIDHGNGWVSQYYHLRRGSIAVEVDDVVTAGQVIGLVGSSGNSGGPHLHFEIQHNKTPVDPFAAASDYFVTPPPYVVDPVLPNNLLDFGITNDIYDGVHTTGIPPNLGGPPFAQLLEKISDIDTFPTSGDQVYAWAIFTSVEAGDTWRAELYRPNGTLVNNFSNATFLQPTDFEEDGDTDGLDFLVWQQNAGTTSGAFRSDGDANFDGAVTGADLALWELQYNKTVINGWEWSWYRPGSTENIPGTWRVDFLYNDVKVGERTFEVGSSLPEMRVFENGAGTYILDGRTTPLDFGSVAQGASAPSLTFKVENHGYGTLNVSSVSLPTGYTITESLDASIAAGASDTFTVELDTAVVGSKTGQIVINSDDASESAFEFAVEGEITAPLAAAITLPASAAYYQGLALYGEFTEQADLPPVEMAIVDASFEQSLPIAEPGATSASISSRSSLIVSQENEPEKAADEAFSELGPLL